MADSASTQNDRHGADEFREKASEIRQNLSDLGQAARHTAEESWDSVRESASSYLEGGRQRAVDLGTTLENRIRERPVQAMLIAVGCGFLIGACFMRR